MRIFLDGKVVESDGWSIRTVGQLMRNLDNLPQLSNRLIESVVVDGIELQDWEANSAVKLPEDAHIHVKTQTVVELLASAVKSAKEYLPRLDDGAVRAASLLQEGRTPEAFRLVGQLVEGLQWYTEFVGSLAALMPQEEPRASERLTELGNVMAELLQSWEGQDHTLLADLLEYELSPQMQRGLEFLETLSPSASSDAGNRE